MSGLPVTLPGSLNLNRRLSQWLAIHAEGTVSVYTGKVELGQGIITALAQIVAEELGIDISRVRLVAASTGGSPNEGVTAGSMSVHDSGGALRQVCAEVRAIYLLAAAARLNLAPDTAVKLEVNDGQIGTGDGKVTSYWVLADEALLDCEACGVALPKPAGHSQLAAQRVDIPDKIMGHARFIQDMSLTGMLYGRVLHPPSPGAVLQPLELETINALPGVVTAVRDGSFIGVVADNEYAVVKALAKLARLASWSETPALPDMNAMPDFLRSQPAETTVFAEKAGANVAAGVREFAAAYSRPFLAHASIGPSCAVALYQPSALKVWTHSQGMHNLRADLAVMFDMPADNIALQHVEGAGCYGHNGADDAAADAALLARAVPGRPVQLQWTREDELGCAPFGAAMAVDLKATIDASGRIATWQHDVWSTGHSMRPGRSKIPVLMAASLLEKGYAKQVAINMPIASGGGAERNSAPLYDFGQWRATSHRSLVMPLRTSSLRSLGAHCNVFAVESFMDEIAASLQIDPLDFRLRHLSDPRALDVLQAVADMSGWRHRAEKTAAGEGRGMGLAFARYKSTGAWCAAVALIDAGQELKVEKLWLAVDVGRVVNLDGVVNQIEGGAIQTVSWVLKEQVQFDRTRVLSNTWESYPILRFSEVPAVEVKVLDRPDQKSIGAGEPTHGPVAAAIANALADALGVRVRNMPLSTDNITQAALAEEAVQN